MWLCLPWQVCVNSHVALGQSLPVRLRRSTPLPVVFLARAALLSCRHSACFQLPFFVRMIRTRLRGRLRNAAQRNGPVAELAVLCHRHALLASNRARGREMAAFPRAERSVLLAAAARAVALLKRQSEARAPSRHRINQHQSPAVACLRRLCHSDRARGRPHSGFPTRPRGVLQPPAARVLRRQVCPSLLVPPTPWQVRAQSVLLPGAAITTAAAAAAAVLPRGRHLCLRWQLLRPDRRVAELPTAPARPAAAYVLRTTAARQLLLRG